MIDAEVLRSRCQQQQVETNQLKEEYVTVIKCFISRIQKLNADISMETFTIQKHQQERMALVNTLSSLQIQKQHEDAELQNLQETKVKVRLLQLI